MYLQTLKIALEQRSLVLEKHLSEEVLRPGRELREYETLLGLTEGEYNGKNACGESWRKDLRDQDSRKSQVE